MLIIILKITISDSVKGVNAMNKKIESELKKLVAKILETIKVNQIILFGSYAYGKPGSQSDIDLCIITEENKRKIDLIKEISLKLFYETDYPLDIIVYKPEEFKYRADSQTTFESQILNKGIVLYG